MKEESNETWEKCEEHLETLSKDKPGIEGNIVIERAHRKAPRPKSYLKVEIQKHNCKCHNYNDKVKALQNTKKLKGTNISINEDFSQEP